MTRLLALLVLVVARLAQAAPFFPCNPVLIAGPQGRPIPNATVQVVNLDGSPLVNGVWLNSMGTQQFLGLLPPDQVLQVFADPGIYRTDISGAGLTKSYEVVCGGGFGSLGNISIDRTADLLLRTTDSPPNGFGCVNNLPCTTAFDPDVLQFVVFDFVMPSHFPLTFLSALLTWHTYLAGPGDVVWSLNWCTYGTGQAPCDPSNGTHKQTKTSTALSLMERVDVVWDASLVGAGAWAVGTHVVVAISREAENPADTLQTDAGLENIQLEFAR